MFELIVRRPVAVAMLSLAAALFGALSYQQRPMSLMPPLTFPSLTIQSRYEGAAPEEVEVELTTPIEERLGTLEGLKSMRSRNQAGVSIVQLELAWGADLNATLQRVYERLDRLQLPPEVEPPQVLRYDPTLDPLMVIALTPPSSPPSPLSAPSHPNSAAQEPTALSLSALRRYAEESLTPAIHQVKGVAAVKVTGGEQARVEVALRPEALTRYGLTPQLIASKLKAAHVNLAGGQLVTDSGEVLVRTLAQLNDLETLKGTIVHQVGEAWVRLSDIAEVRLGVQERTSWVQVGLQEAVRVQIYRQADANLVEVAQGLRAALFKERGDELSTTQLTLRPPHPKGVGVHLVDDQASFIESALSAVGSAILSGGLLAVLILYLFLGSAYQTLVVALSIPLSVILSFIPLHAFGVSLNLMSLGGLALGVGMLVDNAVVVLESIAKRRERGAPPLEAAAEGAREVGGAVFASTLTTVAVFLPVALIDGIAGQVFRDLALTVVSALLASLVVALVVVPTLAARDRAHPQLGAHPQGDEDPKLKEPPQGLKGRGLLPLDHWSRLWQRRDAQGARWYLSLPLTLPLTTLEWGLALVGNLLLAWLLISLATLRLPSRALSVLIGWPMRRLSQLTQRLTAGLERGYAGLIERLLSRPLALISLTGLLVWGSWQLQADIPRSLLPEVEQGALIVELEYPVGTPLEQTRGRVQRWLTRLLESRAPQHPLSAPPSGVKEEALIKRAELLIGQDESDEQSGDERGVHQARLALTLASRGLEEHTSALLRAWADEEPGLKIKVKRPSLLTLKPPLRVALRGHRLSDLKEAERLVYLALKAQPGLSDVERSMEQGYPEVRVEYEEARLNYLGLSPLEVAEQLRAHITGVEALELRWDSVMTPIMVRSQGASELNSERLGELLISTPARLSGSLSEPLTRRPLSLASVATLSRGEGPAEIRHLDGQRAAEVSAYASAFELGERATELEASLNALALPVGVEVSLAGQESEMKESSRALTLTLLLSLFLVFVVMATQFESVRAPLLIMGSVPLAGVGVLIGLWWTQTPLSVVVFVGLITLSGVVVNNAIVYLDAAQRYVGQGLSAASALIEAGRDRLRPILMTTLTTLIGLLPMLSSSGEGAELRAPLALTLIFGLSASTLLVLFVLPALSISLAPPTARDEGAPSPTSPAPTQEVSA